MSSKVSPVISKRKSPRSSAPAGKKHDPVAGDGYRLLLEGNQVGAFRTTLEGRVLDCNDVSLKIFGYGTREQVLNRRAADFYANPDKRASLIDRLLKEGSLTNVELSVRRKNGSRASVLCNLALTVDPTTGRNVIEGAFIDISGWGRTAESSQELESSFRLLFASNPYPVYVYDPVSLRFLEVNEAAIAKYGYSREEFLSMRLPDIRPAEDKTELLKAVAEIRTGAQHVGHWAHRRKDGKSLDVIVTSHLLDFAGRQAALAFVEDVTERNRAEKEVEERAAYFHALVESNPLAIVVLDSNYRVRLCNPAFEKLFQYRQEEILGANIDSLVAPKDLEAEASRLSKGALGGQEVRSTTRRRRKDGLLVDVAVLGVPLIVNGKMLGGFGIYEDITERVRVENARREAEERLRSIFENSVEGMFQTTPDGRYLSLNPALARMYGYASPEELSANVRDIARQVFVDPQRREEFKRLIEERGAVEKFEYQVFRKDGGKIWLSENARAVRDEAGTILYYEGTVEDVTERKRAEAERQVTFEIIHGVSVTENLDDLLRLIHQSLQKVLHASNCFVALHDSKTEMFEFPFFVDEFDSAPAPQKVGRSCTAYVFRTGRAMLIPQSQFDRLVAKGEVELVGTPSPAWIGVPLRTPAATIGVLVLQNYEDERTYTSRDLEFLESVGGQIAIAIERKRAETALRESEARLRVLVEQLPAVLWTTDTDLKFTSSLGAGLSRLGLKPNQVVGQSLYEYFQVNDAEFLPIAAHRQAIAGEAVTFHTEWAGGSYACHVEPLRGADGRTHGAICMALDVTERKQLEAQLRQAQKMEAVGRLAGGIAHDFNNLLMVIQGYTELLLERLIPNDPLRRNAEQIHDASDRAAGLTRQLLAFSRNQLLAPKVLDLQLVVTDMEKMLRRLIGEDIDLATITQPGLWSVKADRSQLEQVILNLAVNARDAMPRGGKLTIETANVDLDNSYARQHPIVTPGPYVMLAVTDTGVGMDAETQAHVFEPFFTTKEKGKGTGLGLATVYGVVKQSGGYVWVYSEEEHGTTFKIYLPRADAAAIAEKRSEAKQRPIRGSETILLVEDERGVRELAREHLESNGYTVLQAGNGQQALDLAAKHSGRIHLLLTDVVMPGMSGRELAEQMQGLRPGIKILYMSGYTDQAIVHHGILAADTLLLQKPFTLHALVGKLREALERSDDSPVNPQPVSSPILGSGRTL
jgi:two-component system cell cycle sensor histidine kinase/response regulator CckA